MLSQEQERTVFEVTTMKREWLLALALLIPAVVMPASQRCSRMASGNETASPEWLALQQSVEKMHAAMMSAESSTNGDVDFVKLMLPHHAAAVDMAKAQLLYGADPQMRRLAQEIITDQQSEIELMQFWLEQHKPQK
jgi:uncharacterized protein (DUF305 family)